MPELSILIFHRLPWIKDNFMSWKKKEKKKKILAFSPQNFSLLYFPMFFQNTSKHFSKHLKNMFFGVSWCFFILVGIFSYLLAFFHTVWALPWLALFHFFPQFFQVFSKKLCTVRSRAIQNATLGIRLFFTMHWSMKNIFPKFGPLNRKTLEDRAFKKKVTKNSLNSVPKSWPCDGPKSGRFSVPKSSPCDGPKKWYVATAQVGPAYP